MFTNPIIYVIEVRNELTGKVTMREVTDRERLMGWGTEFRLCPIHLTKGKILYCSRAGEFISQFGHAQKPVYSPAMSNPLKKYTHGGAYPCMRHFGNANCHVLICTAFHGPRPHGYECDHLNGNILDYRASNLEWVTPAENRRRAKYLRALRELIPTHYRIFQREDYLCWFAMPFEEFEALLSHYVCTNPASPLYSDINLAGDVYEGD